MFEGRYVAAEKFLILFKKVTKVKYNGELLYNAGATGIARSCIVGQFRLQSGNSACSRAIPLAVGGSNSACSRGGQLGGERVN